MNKNRLIILIFILSLFLISSCTKKIPEDGEKKEVECDTDLDCAIAGCSGQLCVQKSQAQDIITTCEYRQEYECLKLISCSCINNKCQWKEDNNYLGCLANTK